MRRKKLINTHPAYRPPLYSDCCDSAWLKNSFKSIVYFADERAATTPAPVDTLL